MAASAMHLVDKVLPDCPLRQWVLSVPYELRRLVSSNTKAFGAVLKIFVRVVAGHYLRRAKLHGITKPKTGMLSIQQRFGGSMNFNPHIHMPAIDGVYTLDDCTDQARFHFQEAPTPEEIEEVARKVSERVAKMLRRKKLITQQTHESNEASNVDCAMDGCRNAALSRGRFERIDEHGRAQQDLFANDLPVARRNKSPFAADIDGFSVEAGVHFGALDRKGRERLIRYCLRPAISNERLMLLRNGSIAYRTKYPMRRGKTHRVMTPIEFMARLASIVAPPRAHLLRYHGVLAANAKWRKLIVPLRERGEQRCASAEHTAKQPAKSEHKTKIASADLSLLAVTTLKIEANWRPSTSYIPWSELLKRSFDFDVLECKKCKARMQPIAVITEREVIERILSHLSLPLQMEALASSGMMGCDISDEAIAESEWNQTSSDADERGPPDESYFVDAPCPDG
jgi:hypothetical protein